MSAEEFFETGPDFERPIFDAVLAHMQTVDPEIWFELLSVGVYFKRRSTFLSLRTMTKWIAVSFSLDRKLDHGRISRKVVAHGSRFFHVVNVRTAAEVDAQLCEWLTEAWVCDE
jgi:hypothetical protein